MGRNRRLYVGNRPYAAQRIDVEELFERNGIAVKSIAISIDPFTDRNPSYCFVDLQDDCDCPHAVAALQGQDVLGRPVKIDYDTRRTRKDEKPDDRYVFDNWTRSDEAPSRWIRPYEEGRRLYIGGLPQIASRPLLNQLMRELFRDWELEAVSKLLYPHPSTRTKRGEHFYCFVDLPTAEIAEAAASALNNSRGPHRGVLRISVASHSYPTKVIREQSLDEYPHLIPQQPAKNLNGNWRATQRSLAREGTSSPKECKSNTEATALAVMADCY